MTRSVATSEASASDEGYFANSIEERVGDFYRCGFTRWDLWAGVVPAVALLPMMLFQLQYLWARPYLRFAPLVWILCAVFAFFLHKSKETLHPVRRWIAVAMLVVAAICYLVAVWQFNLWLAQFTALLVFAAWGLGRFGDRHWASGMAVVGLAATTLPLPWGADANFIEWLQGCAVWATSLSLDALGIANLRQGNLLEIKDNEILVEAIWPGLFSVYAIWAFAALLLILTHRSFFVAIKTFFWVVMWVVLEGYVRMMAISLAQEFGDRDLTNGWDFIILHVSASLMTLLFTWLTIRFVGRMSETVPMADAEFGPVFHGLNRMLCWPQEDPLEATEPEDESEKREYLRIKKKLEESKKKWPAFIWFENSPAKWTTLVSSGCMAVASLAPLGLLFTGAILNLRFGLPSYSQSELEQLPSGDALPRRFGGWQLSGFEVTRRFSHHPAGAYSLNWSYQTASQNMLASLDFPFAGWHDPAEVRSRGSWETLATDVRVDGGGGWPWCEAEMINDLGGKAYLFFALFDQAGKPFEEIPSGYAATASARGVRPDPGIVEMLGGKASPSQSVTWQFQVFCESGQDLTDEERQEIRQQFLELRKTVVSRVTGESTSVTSEQDSASEGGGEAMQQSQANAQNTRDTLQSKS